MSLHGLGHEIEFKYFDKSGKFYRFQSESQLGFEFPKMALRWAVVNAVFPVVRENSIGEVIFVGVFWEHLKDPQVVLTVDTHVSIDL